jgi:hypothetical protein
MSGSHGDKYEYKMTNVLDIVRHVSLIELRRWIMLTKLFILTLHRHKLSEV